MKTFLCLLIVSFFHCNSYALDLKNCLTEGQQGLGGKVLGSNTVDRIKTPCCNGLVEVLSKDSCGQVTGTVQYACTKCGDKVCDNKFESKCNCPADCKIEDKPQEKQQETCLNMFGLKTKCK